jgi:adenylosuccinate synthase
VTEDQALDAELPEPHNATGPWQGAFRRGHFDAVAHRYALAVAGGADALAVSHLDAAVRSAALRLCDGYAIDGRELRELAVGPLGDLDRQRRLTESLLRARPVRLHRPADWTEGISDALGLPVLMTGHGPRTSDVRYRAARPVLSGAVTPLRGRFCTGVPTCSTSCRGA